MCVWVCVCVCGRHAFAVTDVCHKSACKWIMDIVSVAEVLMQQKLLLAGKSNISFWDIGMQ